MMIMDLMCKLRNLILRGKMTSLQQDGDAVYTIQSESLNQNYLGEAYYPYGYAGSPPLSGALVINLALSAQPENVVSLPYNPTSRWKGLQPGEVQIGNQLLETYIKFDAAGNIIIKGNVQVEGDVSATGTISDGATSMTAMRNAYNNHTHPDPQGGDTGPPSIPM